MKYMLLMKYDVEGVPSIDTWAPEDLRRHIQFQHDLDARNGVRPVALPAHRAPQWYSQYTAASDESGASPIAEMVMRVGPCGPVKSCGLNVPRSGAAPSAVISVGASGDLVRVHVSRSDTAPLTAPPALSAKGDLRTQANSSAEGTAVVSRTSMCLKPASRRRATSTSKGGAPAHSRSIEGLGAGNERRTRAITAYDQARAATGTMGRARIGCLESRVA